jgi:putative DNA primase/helicase
VSGPPAGLLAALDRAVLARSGRREGREVRFLCPGHEDHKPSARWNREKAVWQCDACGAGGGALDLAGRLGVELPAVPGRALRETVYLVRDAAGCPVAEHVRQERAGGGKRFLWRRDGAPGLRGIRASELPLYGAERVAGCDLSRPVFVAEGEKAAACLHGIGAQAVGTVTGASGTPGAGPLEVLRGREVVLWPDADAAGARHMERIATALAGVAPAVRTLSPQGLPEGGDAADWIEQRCAAGKPAAAILSELEALAREVPIRAAAAARDQDCAGRPGDAMEAALAGLAAAASVEAAGDWLRQLRVALRGADALARILARERSLAALEGKVKAPAQLVDAALAVPLLPAMGKGRAVDFAEPEPWPEPVDGSALLGELAATLTRFVALPRFADVAAALWTVHAHALEAAGASPLLALTSPEKRCGKTTTLSLLARLVPRALLSSNISPAALFRIVERYSPTLLVDEADSFLREKEELRGILNSGHARDAAYVVRTVGDEHEPRRFSTWAAKAIALIGRLPDTLADRSIVVPMRRRAPGDQVERLRLDRPGAFEDLRRRAARWAADQLAELRGADPEVPGEIGDRAADNWRPLLAIANLAGGEWPERARQAAVALSGGAAEARDSVREQLLADIRETFRERAMERIFTEELLAELRAREDRPWGEWRSGHAMSAVQLARQLKPFGVRPRLFRDGAKSSRGYSVDDFADAFARYLPSADPLLPLQINADAGLPAIPGCYTAGAVTAHENGAKPYRTGVVTGVTGPDPDSRRGGDSGGAAEGDLEVFDL